MRFSIVNNLPIAIAVLLTLTVSQETVALTKQNNADSEWGDSEWGDTWDESSKESLFHGFLEAALSRKVDADVGNRDALQELRGRIEWKDTFSTTQFEFKGDFFYDGIVEKGWDAHVREANALIPIGNNFELKVGRQILTWGTGDLVFINDLFPKDWQSFFVGRDDEYLKAPSDAMKLSWFGEKVSFNLVYSPEFDSDNYINGERLSFYYPGFGIVQPELFPVAKPLSSDDELATRIYGKIDGLEWAFYTYSGFHKTPKGTNALGVPFFPRLEVLGASVRAPIAGGIGSVELGSYNSLDDAKGTNPMIPNDQFKLLLGFEHELMTNVTGSFQLVLDKTHDYQALIANSAVPSQEQAEVHKLLTARVTHQAMQQKLINSLFVFYSPDDKDYHLRLSSSFRYSDDLSLSGGVYWFGGENDFSFWGQFQENSQVFVRLRYNY